MTRPLHALLVAALLATPSAALHAVPAPAVPFYGKHLAQDCANRDGWADPAPPAQVFANTWYVGTCGISAILITGPDGHVLIDGGTAEAAPLVLANIKSLGFDPKDVHWILSTHEHFDHAGALAALKRATGAKLAALAPAAAVLESGKPVADDPQYGALQDLEPVKVDRVLKDGDSVLVARLSFTAHATPAHSPGSTSWTWQSCTQQFDCKMIAYADSATAISADAYRFADHPDRIAAVKQGLAVIGSLPCDILMTPHPGASALMDRLAGKAELVDPAACRTYAAAAQQRFAQRLAEEAKAPRS